MIGHSNLNHLQLSSKWIPTTDPWDFYHMHLFMQYTKKSHKIHLRRHQCSPLRPLRGHFVLRKQRRTVGGARKLRAQRTNGCRNIGVILWCEEWFNSGWICNYELNSKKDPWTNAIIRFSWKYLPTMQEVGCFHLFLLFSVAFTDLNSLGCFPWVSFPWDEIFTMKNTPF